VNWRYRCLGLDLTKAAQVEQPAGAFLMFRREAWQKVGGFDEGFFPVWFEDVDFCKRIRETGYNVCYNPNAVARHSGAHSISLIPLGIRTKYWYGSLLRYSIRHFQPAGRIVTCLSVIAGSILRPVLGGASNRTPDMLRAYAAVVRLAFRSILRGKVQFGETIY
jgi:N-acetylglucosaminyl-diphospho-decaprenol L-rhamnosyltransferase